jgi:hypothetical protein
LIIIATIVQILHNAPGVPEIQLSENATQILIAAIGGIIGVLGGYFGIRLHNYTSSKENYMIEDPTPPNETEPETEPSAPEEEEDDREDVEANPEPEVEGDPHGSPLDDEEDRQFLGQDDSPEVA